MTYDSTSNLAERLRRWRWILILAVLATSWSAADTVLRGGVSNLTTGTAVPGVGVRAQRGGDLIGSAHSDAQGNFTLSVNLPVSQRSQTMTLVTEHADFAGASKNVTVTAGRADSPFYRIELLPRSLGRCVNQGQHGIVVVGHIRPPLAEPAEQYAELAGRMARALQYSLQPRLQQMHVPSDFQPLFIACDEADPRSDVYASHYARALQADAFLSGEIERAMSGFDVATYVSDRFGLFALPVRTVNRSVDLTNSGAAQVDDATHAAILAAVAAGYAHKKRYADCIDVTVAAEQMLGSLTDGLRRTRDECRSRIDNRGLLPTDSP